MTYKLLLSDDSITMQKLVELILAEEGFEIMSTNNGEEALSAISSFKPDIILADVEMPKINGYQLCEKVKQDPSSSEVPVILLAGAFEQFDEELAKKVGADDFIIKPFESQELIGKVHAALAISSAKKGEPAEISTAPEGKIEEDLWAVEEIPEIEGTIEKETLKKEVTVKETVQPVKEEISEAKVIELEVPSKDELKEIFDKNLNEKIAGLISSLNIKEDIVNSYNYHLKETINDIKTDIVDSYNSILKDNINAIKEDIVNSYTTQIKESIYELKEAVTNSCIPLYKNSINNIKEDIINFYTSHIKEITSDIKNDILTSVAPQIKDSVEKIVSETVSNLAEGAIRESIKNTVEYVLSNIETKKILSDTLRNSIEPEIRETMASITTALPQVIENIFREDLRGIIESISKEIQNVVWKTVPDLAESIILKEIERIRSEF